MTLGQDEVDEFLRNPRESFDTELKRWIDPLSDEGVVKIAKAAIALFNNNGGRIIIGFSDDGKPDHQNVPADVRGSFHQDVIQGIVAKHASHAFEVSVDFGQLDNHEFPIITVPSGVETPVAAKRDLAAPDGSNLKPDVIYVRTLDTNTTVSSAQARAKDWDRLVKICFDNREANIGAFFRRHIGQFEDLGFFARNPRVRDPTPIEQATKFLDVGYEQVEKALKRPLPVELGTRESAIRITGEVPPYSLNAEFLWKLESQKPNHTGWTPWMLTEGRLDDTSNAYVLDNGYQRLLLELQGALTFGDFWRIEQGGKFYQLRIYEDDLPGRPGYVKPVPGTQLDFLLQISRTAEIISIGLAFARALGCSEVDTSLAIAMRWKDLEGRHLTSWVEPERMFRGGGASRQDSITSNALVPLETPRSAIAPYVQELVAPVFALFGGMAFDPRVIEGIVNKTVGQRF